MAFKHTLQGRNALTLEGGMCILSDTVEQAQEIGFRNTCGKIGLHIHAKKTQYMGVRQTSNEPLRTMNRLEKYDFT